MKRFLRLFALLAAGLVSAYATPSVSITSPTTGAVYSTVSSPSGVTIAATATATTGYNIATVSFLVNGTSIATATGNASSGTFTTAWLPTEAGTYTLTCKVVDTALSNTTATSASVIVTVSAVQVLTLVAPTEGTSLPVGSSTYLRSAASFTSGAVNRVDFYEGTTLIGNVTTAPYNLPYTYNATGTQAISAVATLSDSTTYISATANVTVVAAVGTGPTVSIAAPTGTDTLAVGSNVTVTATANATNSGGYIPSTSGTGVTFFVDGDPIDPVGSSETNPDLVAPYTLTWKPTEAKTYDLRAQAVDDKGNIRLSGAKSVTAASSLPTIALASPVSGSSYAYGASLVLTANVTASTGATVTKVEFYVNNTLLATVASSPYTATVVPLISGTVTVFARVTDSSGATATSATSTVTFTTSSSTAPTVALTLGGNATSTTVPVGSVRYLTATVTSSSGAAIQYVEFICDSSVVATVSTVSSSTTTAAIYATPFTASLTTGTHILYARATDSAGLVGTSAAVTLTVTSALGSAPTIGITAPSNGAYLPVGANATLTASASDTDGTIAGVQYFANGVYVGSSSTSPYSTTWLPAVQGTYELVAVATDNSGNAVASTAVSVTVTESTSPTIALSLSPSTSTTVAVGSVREVLATVEAQSGRAIASVTWYLDGELVAESSAAPFTYLYTAPTTTGTHVLVARATDNAGVSRDAQLLFSVVSAVGVSPTVSIITPASGTSVVPGTALSIIATAHDTDGTIASVQFYVNGVSAGSATASPYTVSYTPTAAGTYVLTAIAIDDKGNTTLSQSVTIAAAYASPTASITSPSNGAGVTVGTQVSVVASAAGGSSAAVSLVEFFLDDLLLGSDTSSPYSISWTPDSTQVGTHSLTARVTDANSNTATSTAVSVTVSNPVGTLPQISLSGFSTSTTLSYQSLSTVVFIANAFSASSNSSISKVEFFVDSVSIGSASREQSSNYWRLSYSMSNLTVGSHTIYAVAKDSNGNLAASTTYTFTVVTSSSLAPTVSTFTATPQSVIAGATVLLFADVTDSDGSIASVQFYANGTLIGSVTSSPYQYSYTTKSAGKYNLYAVVTDDTGNTAMSSVVALTVTGNTAPTIALVRPSDDTLTGTVGQGVFLEATASDTDTSQTLTVDFLANGSSVATASRLGTTTTYRATWTPTTANSYTVQARATDSGGSATLSSPTRTVTISAISGTSPTVSLTAPSSATTASTVVLTATATDTDGSVSSVEFFVAGASIGTGTRDNLSNVWRTKTSFGSLGAGTYAIVAVAKDNSGNSVNSGSSNISVSSTSNNVPSLTFAVSATSIGLYQTIKLTSTALDADGTISSVRYYANGTSIGSSSSSSASYLVSWTPSASGTYNVYAVVTDNSGNTAVAADKTVTVARYQPVLDDSSFIYQTYQDLIATTPDATTLAGYAAMMAAGTLTREQLVLKLAAQSGFTPSYNAVAAYYLLMGSWPTFADFQTLQTNATTSIETAINTILASADYAFLWRDYPLPTTFDSSTAYSTVQAFVNRLYQAALGRNASALEILQFTNNDTATSTIGRGYNSVGISTAIAELITIKFASSSGFSSLSRRIRIAALTYTLLDAQPTTAQLDTWAALSSDTALASALLDDSLYGYRFVTFTTHPKALTVASGSGALFNVEAAGAPPLSYQWLYNGVAISGETNSFLSLASVDSTKTGYYSVRVTSASAVNVSDSAQLAISSSPSHLLNLSTRGVVGSSGGGELIAGFVIIGTQSRQVLVRTLGPGLSQLGVTGAVADPTLTVYNSSGKAVAQNDNWSENQSSSAVSQIETITSRLGATALTRGTKDAAVLATLQPGVYTVLASVASGSSGVGLVEIYDGNSGISSTNKISNISTRGAVGTGEKVLIGGFVLEGTVARRILIRGIGPGLSALGVSGVLAAPKIALASGSTTLKTNSGWSTGDDASVISAAAKKAGAFSLTGGSKDAAMIVMLEPGAYTITLAGVDSTTGNALVEIYDMD